MEKYQVEGKALLNLLKNKGVEQEINRTFLHPLGLELNLNEKNELELWRTNDPKGFVYEKINPMHSKVFGTFASSKSAKRMNKLGFSIQVKDLFRSNKLEEVTNLLIKPERKKVELIIACLSTFSHLLYERIIRNHKIKDQILDPEQFNKEELLNSLMKNIENKDWIDVANLAMMLHQSETLTNEIKAIQEYKKEYDFEMSKEGVNNER